MYDELYLESSSFYNAHPAVMHKKKVVVLYLVHVLIR